MHAGNLVEYFTGTGTEGFFQHPVATDPALQGVGDGTRLLEDLLEHVMGIIALVRRIQCYF